MALILPVLLLIVLGTLEFGFIMDHKLTLQYASREASRVGAALATGGGSPGCLTVDNEIIAAAQRILESSDSNIEIERVSEIRIFRSTLNAGDADGREEAGDPVNVWIYDAGNGPTVDGVPLDFRPVERRLVQRLWTDQHRRQPRVDRGQRAPTPTSRGPRSRPSSTW